MAYLKVTPDKTIEFPMILYSSVQANVKLENISETVQCIAFKIKTTAPKKYLVRPSTGVIRHNEECDVLITLQPLTEDIETCLDRFLIQYTVIDNDEPLSRDYWINVNRSLVCDKRLGVAFIKYNKTANEELLNTSSIINASNISPSILSPTNGMTAPSTIDNISNNNNNNNISTNPSIYPFYEFSSNSNNLNNNNTSNSCMSSISNSPINQNDTLLKQKYDELIRYCLAVEKQKNSLQKENEILKKMAQTRTNTQTQRSTSFIELLYFLPLVLCALIVARLLGFL